MRRLWPWCFPDNSTGVGCHFLLQGIFQTQVSNPGLPHCRQMLYHLSHQGNPVIQGYSVLIQHTDREANSSDWPLYLPKVQSKCACVCLYSFKQSTCVSFSIKKRQFLLWDKWNSVLEKLLHLVHCFLQIFLYTPFPVLVWRKRMQNLPIV